MLNRKPLPILLLLSILCATTAQAWQCEVHLALTANAAPDLVQFHPWSMCASYRSRHANVQSRYAPYGQCDNNYLAGFLMDGSYYPDTGQWDDPFPGRNSGNALGHLHDADGHALRALSSAVRQCHNKLPCGRGGAYWNLGNSLHYLQDHGDPSKWVDYLMYRNQANNRKSFVRRLTNDYLQGHTLEWLGRYIPHYQQQAQSMIAGLYRVSDPKELLGRLGRIRDGSVTAMREAFDAHANDPGYFDRNQLHRVVLREIVLSTEAISLAGRRWVEFFRQSCQQQPDHRVVECNETAKQGADTPETVRVNVINRRRVGFWYNTHTKKDRIKVWYGNELILDTGCVGESRSRDFHLSGHSSHLTIAVEPNCDGGNNTRWDFKVSCN